MQKKENIKKICFNIDKDLHWNAKTIAMNNHTTVTELYNQWITDGVKKALGE